jgi:protein arginine N-methyltransferase 1
MKKQNEKTSKVTDSQPKYTKPKLKKYGRIDKISQTLSQGGPSDAGGLPSNKMMCLTPPPAIEEHRLLLEDSTCQESYIRLISETVKKDDVVLDLGTGSGIHTLFALKAGAKKVYAIDFDDVIHTAQAVIEKNGYKNKVEFIKGLSNEITLPEKVDVIISNIGFLSTVQDLSGAMKKFLKPGGKCIPDTLKINFSPYSDQNFYDAKVNFWNKDMYGFDFSSLRSLAANHPMYLQVEPQGLLSSFWGSEQIELSEKNEVLNWETQFTIEKTGTCHGLGGYYSFFVEGKEYLSTKPPHGMNKEIWNNFLLPFTTPLELKTGDSLKVHVTMKPFAKNGQPVWSWTTMVNGKICFEQATA